MYLMWKQRRITYFSIMYVEFLFKYFNDYYLCTYIPQCDHVCLCLSLAALGISDRFVDYVTNVNWITLRSNNQNDT